METGADPRVDFIKAAAEACLGASGPLFDGLIADAEPAGRLAAFLEGGEQSPYFVLVMRY